MVWWQFGVSAATLTAALAAAIYAKRAAEETKRSAEAATTANHLNIANNSRQLRPWLFLEAAIIAANGSNDLFDLGLTIKLRNFGNSPARNVRIDINCTAGLTNVKISKYQFSDMPVEPVLPGGDDISNYGIMFERDTFYAAIEREDMSYCAMIQIDIICHYQAVFDALDREPRCYSMRYDFDRDPFGAPISYHNLFNDGDAIDKVRLSRSSGGERMQDDE